MALRLQTPVSQRIEAALVRRSDKVTAVASWVGKSIQEYQPQSGNVVITGNGVEQCFFEAALPEGADPFVLYVGRLVQGKGVSELIDAAKVVTDRLADSRLRFVLVGDGPLRESLEEQVRHLGLQDRVEFRGQIDAANRAQLVQLYRQALMFVLPSHHEGMPTVLLEAMACRAPAISTAVGGALEVISPGENGLLVPPRSPIALAGAMIALIENDALREQLRNNAQDTVRRRFSWDAVTNRYLSCYAEALGQ